MDEYEIREVDAARMQEIQNSYSGDTIASGSSVRKPFKVGGKLYVSTSGFSGPGMPQENKCYMLIPREEFEGDAVYYGQKPTWLIVITNGEEEYAEDWSGQRRCQPEGFYHRMLIKRGKSLWVLIGPPILFRLKQKLVAPKQLALGLEGGSYENASTNRSRQKL